MDNNETSAFKYKPRQQKLHIDDPGLLEKIAKLGATLALGKATAATLLGVSKSTFYNFLADNPEAMEAWEDGRAMGRLDFAKTGYIHARSDPSTWRFLAKQKRYLNMSDTPVADKKIEAEVVQMKSRAELEARVIELMRKVQPPAANKGKVTGKAIARRP